MVLSGATRALRKSLRCEEGRNANSMASHDSEMTVFNTEEVDVTHQNLFLEPFAVKVYASLKSESSPFHRDFL